MCKEASGRNLVFGVLIVLVFTATPALAGPFEDNVQLHLVKPDNTVSSQKGKINVAGEGTTNAQVTSGFHPIDQEGDYYWCFRTNEVSKSSCQSTGHPSSCDNCDIVVTHAYEVDYDKYKDQCVSIMGQSSSWKDDMDSTEENRCCGDDEDDEGYVAASTNSWDYLCIDKNQDGKPEWVSSLENSNEAEGSCIYRINQSGEVFDVTSTDENWYACNIEGTNPYGTSYKNPGEDVAEGEQPCVQASGGECNMAYMCYDNNGVGTFGKCGGSKCGYSEAGNVFPTGAQMFINDQYYYCTVGGTWEYDLDCDEQSCTLAGLEWTGTKCCGDDKGDFYNDKSLETEGTPALGGCFAGAMVASDERVRDTNLLNDDLWTEFGSCATDSNYLEETLDPNPGCTSSDFGWEQYLYLYPETHHNFSMTIDQESYANAYGKVFDVADVPGYSMIYDFNSGSPHTKTKVFEDEAGMENENKVRAGLQSGYSSATFDDVKVRFIEDSMMNKDGYFYGCHLGQEYYENEDNPGDAAPSACSNDGCNGNCPSGCSSAADDPDCGCQDGDGCCGIGCSAEDDSDCAAAGGLCELDSSTLPCELQ